MSCPYRWLSLLVCLLSPLSLTADELPRRAIARLGDYGFYHGPGIHTALLSPDGRRMVSAASYPIYLHAPNEKQRDDYARRIIVWDATTGEQFRELLGPGAAQWLAFSPDSKRLAVSYLLAGKIGIVLFDLESGKLLREFNGFEQPILGIRFTENGTQLLVREGFTTLTSLEVGTGKQLKRWKPSVPAAWLKADLSGVQARLSPDGKFVAWLGCKLPEGFIPPPNISEPTALVVTEVATDKTLYWKTVNGHNLLEFVFSPDSRWFTMRGEKFTAWETATGKEIFSCDTRDCYNLAVSPDGQQAVVASAYSQVQLWDLVAKKPSFALCQGLCYISSNTLETPQSFSADGKKVVVATDSTLRLFDTTTGKELPNAGHRTPIVPRFSAEGRTLFTTCKEMRRTWDVSPGKEPAVLTSEPRHAWEGICGAQALGHSADGRLFVDRTERGTYLKTTATGRDLHQLASERFIYMAHFSPDKSRVVLSHESPNANPEFLRIYDTKTGKPVGDIPVPDWVLRTVAYSADGRLLAWTDRSSVVHLHDGVTGKAVRTLESIRPLDRAECNQATFLFSPDGESLAVTTAHDGVTLEESERYTHPVRIFHVASERETARFFTNPEKEDKGRMLSCMAWSPDGRLLAVAEEQSGTIRLLEIASGKVRAELLGHRHGVRGLDFTPDGKTLASGGEDNVVYLWDVTGARTGTAIKTVDEKDLTVWWNELGFRDAKRAGDAIACFIRYPQSVAFLKLHVRPTEGTDDKTLARLIANLNADNFEEREAASRSLADLGESAEAALRQSVKGNPPPEAKRRILELLEKLDQHTLVPETLRSLRALEVLEHLGTLEARSLLEKLAKGSDGMRLTRDAKASLKRLEKKEQR